MGSFRFPLFQPPSSFTAATLTLGTLDFTLPMMGVRYPGAMVSMVSVAQTVPGATGTLFAPAQGVMRNLGAGTGPLGTTLYELSPLPFPIAAALRSCRGGCPTFYFGLGSATSVMDGDLVAPAQTLVGGTTPPLFFGVRMQDGLSLQPWAWIRALDDAMAAAGEAATDPDRVAWALLLGALAGNRLVLLEADGGPSRRALEYRVGTGAWTPLTSDARGLILPGGAGAVELRLASPPATARPAFSLYLGDLPATTTTSVTAADDPLPATFTLPAGLGAGYLQVIDLDQWLSTRPAIATPPFAGWTALSRYHVDSRVQPFVDGNPTFAALSADLAAAAGGGGAHLAGLVFKDFPLVEGDGTTSWLTLANAIGQTPCLVFKYANLTTAQWAALQALLSVGGNVLGFVIAVGTIIFFGVPALYRFSHAAVTVVLVAMDLIAVAIASLAFEALSSGSFRDVVESLVEPSKPLFSQLAGIWSRYPAQLGDNPLGGGHLFDPLNLETGISHFGAWNQKLQLIRTSGATPAHIAWLGGADLDSALVDDPGHRGKPLAQEGKPVDWSQHPVHVVHARVTGAAAADLFKTWNERYEYERTVAGATTLPARLINPPPEPPTLAIAGGPHIVQIGRTCFRPGAGGSGLPFAPQGETTTHDTMLKAILQSRDYIYIEDQYFTPPGETGDVDASGAPNTWFAALVAAAATPNPDKKLIILVPSENDQPFGRQRRNHLYAELQHAWGNRLVFGSLVRPPVLVAAGNYAHEGRCVLFNDLDETAADVQLGPVSRLSAGAEVPFWLWIDGELMLAYAYRDPVPSVGVPGFPDSTPGVHVLVYRAGTVGDDGPQSGWPGEQPSSSSRRHKKGAAVTLAQMKGISVRSKVMVIDDLFVAIGSSNLSRRGLFHDGEAVSFAIPRALRSAADNPARALRTALWAEHLGLPPEMGAALLADPGSAFELFRRSFFVGNRVVPVEAFLTRPFGTSTTSLATTGSTLKVIFKVGEFGVGLIGGILTEVMRQELWSKVFDPTTSADPHPESTITP